MSATWQDQKYTVTCPTCSIERVVSRVQYWRLNKGLRKECKSCSVKGRKYLNRPKGYKRPDVAEYMKGNSYAKGFNEYSPEERERRRLVMLGNKFNPGKRGAEHHSWKGGTYGTERHRAMFQKEYKDWRLAVFKRDNYTCQNCQATDIYLHADHVIEWSKDESLRYDVTNGLTLCYKCHYKKTFGKFNETKALLWGVPAKYRKGN